MSDPLASIRALIDKWQREGAIKDTFHATMGIGWKVCAEELSAVLASVPPYPEEHLAVRIQNDLNTFDQIHSEGIDADRVALIRDTLVKEQQP